MGQLAFIFIGIPVILVALIVLKYGVIIIISLSKWLYAILDYPNCHDLNGIFREKMEQLKKAIKNWPKFKGYVYGPSPSRNQIQLDKENGYMKTITFKQGACEICGKEFIALSDDKLDELSRVVVNLDDDIVIEKIVCQDCLAHLKETTTPNYSRKNEHTCTSAAERFFDIFRQNKSK